MSRHNTLFSIRYAVRVLERYARYWRSVDALTRFASFMAGTAAIAALAATCQELTMLAGVVFALLQGIEFVLRPAEKSALAMMQRRPYADLLAGEASHDDATLERGYQAIVAADELVISRPLKELAYNDVVVERGCDPAQAFPLSVWQRVLARLS